MILSILFRQPNDSNNPDASNLKYAVGILIIMTIVVDLVFIKANLYDSTYEILSTVAFAMAIYRISKWKTPHH
jgi:hypothetical protein